MSALITTNKEPPPPGNQTGNAAAEVPRSSHPETITTPFAIYRRRVRGSSTVEFAITASLFFLMMLMIFDFGLYSFIKLTMQHAVREGARYAITGQVDLDPKAEYNRQRAVIQKIREHSMGYFDEVLAESDITVTNSDGVPVTGFGAPGESIVITFNCQWPIINPFTQAILQKSHYDFSVRASMRNEDFPDVSL